MIPSIMDVGIRTFVIQSTPTFLVYGEVSKVKNVGLTIAAILV